MKRQAFILTVLGLLSFYNQTLAKGFDATAQSLSTGPTLTPFTANPQDSCAGWLQDPQNIRFARTSRGGLLYCDPVEQRWRAPPGGPGDWCGGGNIGVNNNYSGMGGDCEYVNPQNACPPGYTRMTARMNSKAIYTIFITDMVTCVVSP